MPSFPYRAPLDDMMFSLHAIGRLHELLGLDAYSHISNELVDAVLEEAAKFSEHVLFPLNQSGDSQGCHLDAEGVVSTPEGFREAYQEFTENGWNGVSTSLELGGQQLPHSISVILEEMLNSANMAFALCPMLTQGAMQLLEMFGSLELQSAYLPKLISGEWTGTMCMTEPQAGSDVGAVRTRAEFDDGQYRIFGTKIFITYGEHDFTENIIHMVLARLPDAPEGTKGLSLFLVPKYVLDEDGQPAERNDVTCVSLEHKMGIHASPTAVLSFGERDGAVGYLIGEANGGIRAMFSMMNSARLAVGVEGVGVASYASQLAHAYAGERVQGVGFDTGEPATIANHPDVTRMLADIRSGSEGLRALAVYSGRLMDLSAHASSEDVKQAAQTRLDLFIPIVKAFCTDQAFLLTSEAVQVFGGMGYIRETGIEQLLRDIRIAPIYEGTNGIQAWDLVRRKILMDSGAVMKDLIAEIWECGVTLSQQEDPTLAQIGYALSDASKQLDVANIWLQQTHQDAQSDPSKYPLLQFCSSDYLALMGTVIVGFLLGSGAFFASKWQGADKKNAPYAFSEVFLADKIQLASYYCGRQLPLCHYLSKQVIESEAVMKNANRS